MLAFDSAPPPPHEEAVKNAPHGNESYLALVWRRLRRSWTGMMGLILVGLLLLMAIFADFFAPMDPKATDVGFAPPQMIELPRQGRQSHLSAARLCARRIRGARSRYLPADRRP